MFSPPGACFGVSLLGFAIFPVPTGMLQSPPDFLGVSFAWGCAGMAMLQGWAALLSWWEREHNISDFC